MLGERRGFLFLRVLNLKRTGTRLCKFDRERARPSGWYRLRAGLGRERLIDGQLATSEEDLRSRPTVVSLKQKEVDNFGGTRR